MKTFEGKLVSKQIKIGIVAARFNEFITAKLLSGAMDGLVRHDVAEEDVNVAWVPGAFEIPLIASKMAKSGKYDAVILAVAHQQFKVMGADAIRALGKADHVLYDLKYVLSQAESDLRL